MDATHLIGQCEYFKSLPSEHRQALAALCVKQQVSKGDSLFLEGEPVTAVFLLAEGGVQLVKTAPDGREVVIRTVEPGEIFAEAALLRGGSYPVTAHVLQDGVLFKILKEDFLDLLKHDAFRTEFEVGLMMRIRYLADRLLYLTAYEVDERFFQFLRQQYGEQEEYRISLSKKDLASEIGTTPESLSRLIRRLTDDGMLSWEGETLRLRPGYWAEHGRDE